MNDGESTTIEILNLTGKLELQIPLIVGKNQIDLSEFSKGIYFAKISKNGKEQVLMKIVKI
jgi:Secretion system C-terminal sorting domain